MQNIPGTQGYQTDPESLIKASQKLDFFDVCKDFVSYLPANGAQILDAGCGAGQNAAALCQAGYHLTAVEPLAEFLSAAKTKYAALDIQWLQGHLPDLQCISDNSQFDFILCEGVLHHLQPEQQKNAIKRFHALLKPTGKIALSLRNGPAGAGTCVYPTHAPDLLHYASTIGLECLFDSGVQPSIYKHKVGVTFQRVVLGNGECGS